jgi:hypothetical protein
MLRKVKRAKNWLFLEKFKKENLKKVKKKTYKENLKKT